MFYISFDFGTKNIGVAIGQNVTNTANMLHSIKVNRGIPNWIAIKNILLEWKPKSLIVGYPLNINGTKQKMTQKVECFAKNLTRRFNIPVIFHDERLTTVEAKEWLFKNHGYKSLIKKNIDAFSALIILESWLVSII